MNLQETSVAKVTKTLKDGGTVYSDEKGSSFVRTKGAAILMRSEGIVGMPLFDAAIGDYERAIKGNPRIDFFFDVSKLKSVGPGYSDAWRNWLRDHNSRGKLHVLVNSAVVSMIVRVSSVFIKEDITSYSDAKKFEAAIAAANK